MSDWNPKANDFFVLAAEIPAPADRRLFLEQQCGGDDALRAQVESLLDAGGKMGSFLDKPAAPGLAANGPTLAQPGIQEGPGTVIGTYKLLQKLGEGGMGTVYMAEQQAPVQRKVALKIIKPGMDSNQVIARFEAERQALAMMDHPNIARVFDAGTVGQAFQPDQPPGQAGKPDLHTGRPYFVMELVKGVPITDYCNERRLGPRQRLELFVLVCRAVQHAHQKGIIHRDLKPGNVLVALYDGQPVPKVIDFGVAKATGSKLTEKTLFTGFGTLVGTLEYMSPEQAELNQLDIDTRSDVYSLGVLLYELLTGSTPIGRDRLKEAVLLEVLRCIREEDPPKPSTRLSTAEGLATLSAQRSTEPDKLARQVRGDLDWIVMKALEKDRNRRYETANGLALDIERHLADEPVEACPPSAGYRLRKFARRHKGGLAAAVSIALLLLLGVTFATWQAVRARQAEIAARAALEEAVMADLKAADAFQQAETKAKDTGIAGQATAAPGIRPAAKLVTEANRQRDEALKEAARLRAENEKLRKEAGR